jgi:hypothetical protein
MNIDFLYFMESLKITQTLVPPPHHGCTVHSNVIQSFSSPTNAQPVCFKILQFTLKYTINAPTCFGLTKPSSGSLQSVLR